jgi:Domain of unknown function (DUF1707)/Cell wall-active antibiotics response 4TMS YvqF
MDPLGFNANSGLRASDADRDRAASVLNEALAEGRLTPEEHSERLDSIYAAKTQADLVPVLKDLPAVADSGSSRKGAWRVPPTIEVVTVFGGADIDLRDAILPGREISMRAVSVFGGLSITVPPEMRVIDSGVAIFGGRDVSGEIAESAAPDGPVLRLQGACVFGGVSVKHKPRRPQRRSPVTDHENHDHGP